ncbi:MAG TPA: hypothetical protein VFZ16_04305 [Hyphomicrobiaceae bacterium]|nr:hypothetical protein [Hyphomicrobiaceae bacterium]
MADAAPIERAQTVDYAAWGLLRLRFVRAVLASCLLVVIIHLAVVLASVQLDSLVDFTRTGLQEWDTAFYHVLTTVGLVLVGMAIAMVLTSLAGAVLRWTPRRLVAAVALVALLPPVLGLGKMVLQALYVWVGAILMSWHGSEFAPELLHFFGDYRYWLVFPLLVALSLVVALEGTSWACWQLTASRQQFYAACGWQSPTWRLMTTFRLHLGLPPFLANFGPGTLSLGLLYLGVAILNIGIVAMILAPLALFADMREPAPALNLANGILGSLALLFALNLLGAGRWLVAVANRRATDLYQSVREWDDRAPVVFLRSFDQDKAAIDTTTRDPFLRLAAGVVVSRTIDEILLENASPYGPVIAIGDPRDPTPPLGAARVFVPGENASWQDVVTGLVTASKAVVICPGKSEGVRWELDLVDRVGAAERTIYLANPSLAPDDMTTLLETIAPQGAGQHLSLGQVAIAAFNDPAAGWRVLSARRVSVQTLTVALNAALQAVLGMRGVPLIPVDRRTARKGAGAWLRALGRTAAVILLYAVAFFAVSIAIAHHEGLTGLHRLSLLLVGAGVGWTAGLMWLGRALDALWSAVRRKAVPADGVAVAVAGVLLTGLAPALFQHLMSTKTFSAYMLLWLLVWLGPALVLLGGQRLVRALARRARSRSR